MDATALLRYVRSGVLVVDRLGTIVQAEGGLGGIFGREPNDLVDHHVLEFIDPAEHASIAEIFATGDDELPIVAFPTSFSVTVVDEEGERSVADVVPSGFTEGDEEGWVITVTSHDIQPAPYRILDSVISGGSLENILQEVCERFDVDNGDGSRTEALGLFAEPDGGDVHVLHARVENPIADALARSLTGHTLDTWLADDQGELTEACIRSLPDDVARAAHTAGYTAVQTGTVALDGHCVAAVLWLVTSLARDSVRANAALVRSSIMRIVDLAVRRDRADRLLRHAATHDPLTGLTNRTGLDRVVGGLDPDAPIAVVFVDIDDFKRVNDRYGHQVGDTVLVTIGDRLRGACRPSDVICRLGGDEFAVLLDGADESTARHVASRVLDTSARPLELDVGPDRVTVTVGVSPAGVGRTMSQLMEQADQAMLRGKRTGLAGTVLPTV